MPALSPLSPAAVPASVLPAGGLVGDPLAALALVLLAGAYAHGVQRLRAAAGRADLPPRWQTRVFAGAVLILAVALVGPVEVLSGRMLVVHMVQHLLLVLLAAPLLALAAPGLPLVYALPPRWRERVRRARLPARLRRGAFGLLGLLAACGVHVAVLWVWHVPALYELALGSAVAHAAQHLTMLGSAVLVWLAVLSRGGPMRRASPAGALAMFAVATLTVGLAALITFAPAPLYPTYGSGAALWGLTALEDQQVAGAVMWSVSGVGYAAAGAVLLGMWLARAEHLPGSAGRG